MTKDLAVLIYKDKLTPEHYLTTEGFIDEIAKNVGEKY